MFVHRSREQARSTVSCLLVVVLFYDNAVSDLLK